MEWQARYPRARPGATGRAKHRPEQRKEAPRRAIHIASGRASVDDARLMSADCHRIARSWLALLAAALLSVGAASAALAQDAPDSTAMLAPTSRPPWNPGAPVPGARGWEHAVRFPGKVASIPFSLLGLGARGGLLLIEESQLVPRVQARLLWVQRLGLIAGPASLGDRSGFGGEVGVNPPFFRSLVAKASGTTAGYSRVHVALEATKGMVEYQSNWRPRDPFFGLGPDSRLDDASNFASQSQFARAVLRYPFRRVATREFELLEDPAVRTETREPPRHGVRAWAGARDVVELEGRERREGRLPLGERFPALAAGRLGTRVEHFIYGAEGTLDHRSGRPHWWKGWRLVSAVERYDEPLEALAFHSASTPSVAFTRWRHEGDLAFSFWRDPRTFRLSARVEDVTYLGDSGLFLLRDLSTLGGGAGLAGFEPGRFRDFDAVLGKLTYIFPLARYLEGDLHVESGQVLRGVGDARLVDFESSYGAALRIRSSLAPFASFGMDWSRETARFRFSLGNVE